MSMGWKDIHINISNINPHYLHFLVPSSKKSLMALTTNCNPSLGTKRLSSSIDVCEYFAIIDRCGFDQTPFCLQTSRPSILTLTIISFSIVDARSKLTFGGGGREERRRRRSSSSESTTMA